MFKYGSAAPRRQLPLSEKLRAANEVLLHHGIAPAQQLGQSYKACPECGPHMRKKSKQEKKVLGVGIDDEGVVWFCHRCRWTKHQSYTDMGI